MVIFLSEVCGVLQTIGASVLKSTAPIFAFIDSEVTTHEFHIDRGGCAYPT